MLETPRRQVQNTPADRPNANVPNPLQDQLLSPAPAQTQAVRGSDADVWRCRRLSARDVVVAVVLFAATLVARWPFIAQGETLMHSDEAIVGIMAQDIAEGTRFPVYFYGQRYMGALEAYAIALVQPLFEDPITSLRFGPALFMAAFCAVTYLMLTQWFGRSGGLVGALSLIACGPMFMQWSISARGGYIEILLWGTMLWWAYTAWFAGGSGPVSTLRKFTFGLLLGSGLWINPTLAVFVAPMALHAMMLQPLVIARAQSTLKPLFDWSDRTFVSLPIALPVFLLVAVATFSGMKGVWVDQGEIHRSVFFNLFPNPFGQVALLVTAAAIGWFIWRRTSAVAFAQASVNSVAPALLGVVCGMIPVMFYVVSHAIGGVPLDPSLPLGLRPIWTVGETLVYLMTGMPMLFAADGTAFLDLIRVGRSYETRPLPLEMQAAMSACDWLVFGAVVSAAILFVRAYGREMSNALRLRAVPHGPVPFLLLAFFGIPALYVMGGCTIDFTTIRYLVPIWAVIPGLLAALAAAKSAGRARWMPIAALLFAWSAGQYGFYRQLGAPHPLSQVADALQKSHAHQAGLILAEPLDAHLLSFLTQQQPQVGEYQSFWPRLAHMRTNATESASPHRYLVDARMVDWGRDWGRGGWPSMPPPETSRFLFPALLLEQYRNPGNILRRTPVCGPYEIWELAKPLYEHVME